MSGTIYVINQDGTLSAATEQRYDTEAVLQELLATYPDLLAGDQVSSGEPRRWLFVSRELGVPGDESGTDQWSVDHLFLDQDAVPTIVEVKRSTDSRIRREVVGQMLDYASHAVVHWTSERVRAKFEATCELLAVDPSEHLLHVVGAESDENHYWDLVDTNLRAGKIRLIDAWS